VTAKKIHILGSHYKDELLKQIPAQNLPKKFGGTSETAGPVELSDEGPWTDPKYATPAAATTQQTQPAGQLISGTATTSAAHPATGSTAAI
jgi:hypothetical protein